MKRKTTTQTANPLVAMMAGLAISAGTVTAQTVFFDNFENGPNDATLNDTVGSYSQTPDVDSAQSDGNTSGAVNSTLWVKANQGFGSTRQGLVDESHGDFTDPVGEQAWAFRYTNSGLTTAEGVIGALSPGATYTVTFDVVEDGHNSTTPWNVKLGTFNGAARNDIRSDSFFTKVLATASGNAPVGGAYQSVNFSYTVNPAADASVLGHDVVVRFQGATSSAIIDNVKVEVDISGVAHWDINGSGTGAGGASPAGTWDAATTNWNPEPDGTGTTAAWTPGDTPIFAAGADATGSYSVTVDGTQNIAGLIVEEGSVSLIDGTSGGLNMTASSPVVVVPGSELNIGVPFTDATGTEVLTKGGDGKLTLSADNSGATGGMVLNTGITQFNTLASINGSGANVLIGNNGIASFGGTIAGGDIPSVLSRIDPASTGFIAVDGYAGTAFDFSVDGLGTAYLAAIADTTLTGLHTPAGTTYRLGGAGGKLTLTDASGMNEASPTFQVLGNVEISGNITAVTGTLTKQNSGTLILSGANSYSANTTASGGILRLVGSNSAATQTTVNAATLQLASSSNGGLSSGGVTLNNNSAALQAVDADRTISNDVLLNASPTINGAQSLTINGALTGNNNRELYNDINAPGKSLTLAGPVNISDSGTTRTLTLRSRINSSDVRFNVTGDIVNGGTATGGNISLIAAFRDNAPFYFSGTNTYSGKTEILNGTLFIQGMQALSPDTFVRLNHTSGNNGKIWLLDDAAGTINLPNTFEIYTNNSTGNHTLFVGNNNTANGGTSSGTTTGSTIAIPALNSEFVKGDTQYQEVNILGANDYSLRISSMELNNLTARNAGATTETRLNPTTANVSIGNITMAAGNTGPVNDGVPLLVLDGTGTVNEVTGAISDAPDALTTGQPLPLIKRDSSTWTLSGANTYTGGTTVSAGTLTLDGSLADASMTISSGTVNGSGTLTFNVSGATIDQIVMTGGTLDASALTVNVNGTLTETEYVLVNATTAPGAISGTFAGLTGASGYVLDYGTTDQVKLVQSGGPSDPYDIWATGGEQFGDDANGDGVSNGLAFLLGAANPDANALGLLPTVTQSGGGLVLTFSMLNSGSRGTAALNVEHSSDLGITDAWITVLVPDANGGPTSGVTFTVTPNGGLNDVVATISSSEAAAGKLFGRLKATE